MGLVHRARASRAAWALAVACFPVTLVAQTTDPINASHLMGTVMHSLFDMSAVRVVQGASRQLMRALEESRPIAELV